MKRAAYALLGLAFVVSAAGVVISHHGSWWPVVVFAIAPDITLLGGAAPGLQRGQLHPRAVPFYNAVHRFWAPGVMALLALLIQADPWLAAGLAWCAHIAIDRSLGFGLRTAQGFQRDSG